MEWARRVLIASDAVVAQCRAMAVAVAGDAGAGMWERGLSQDGTEPATHWISSGCISQEFADMLASPANLAAGTGITNAQATALLSQCIVSDGEPDQVLADNDLQLINDE